MTWTHDRARGLVLPGVAYREPDAVARHLVRHLAENEGELRRPRLDQVARAAGG